MKFTDADKILRVLAVNNGGTTYATSYVYALYGEGKEWHRTREGAVERAEQIRSSKIRSLMKQIEAAMAINF
jgi:hypothetical protein